MIAALAVAALLSAQAAPGPSATSAAALPAPAASGDAPPDLDALRQMYRDTCEAREFGAYDDMCDELRQQVREAERQAAQGARRRPTAAASPPPPPPRAP